MVEKALGSSVCSLYWEVREKEEVVVVIEGFGERDGDLPNSCDSTITINTTFLPLRFDWNMLATHLPEGCAGTDSVFKLEENS